MAVLLLADVNNGQLATDAVAKTLDAVKSLGDVHVLVAGEGGDAAAAEAATLAGVSKVLFAGAHDYCHGMAEATAALVAQYVAVLDGGANYLQAIIKLWGPDEKAIVASIISFWFVDRSLRKGFGK